MTALGEEDAERHPQAAREMVMYALRSSSFRVGTEGAGVSSGVGTGVEKVFKVFFNSTLFTKLWPCRIAMGVVVGVVGARIVATGVGSGDATKRTPAKQSKASSPSVAVLSMFNCSCWQYSMETQLASVE